MNIKEKIYPLLKMVKSSTFLKSGFGIGILIA